jgi:hypothetical protein
MVLPNRMQLAVAAGVLSVRGAILRSTKNTALRCVVAICVPAASSCFSHVETLEARTLLALAPKVSFLCDFATYFRPAPKLVASWNALEDPRLDSSNLLTLLKCPDPKIRALAIFALDRKNDPRVLPQIAALQSDQAVAYSCPVAVAQPLPPDRPRTWPQQPSAVGALANEVVPVRPQSGHSLKSRHDPKILRFETRPWPNIAAAFVHPFRSGCPGTRLACLSRGAEVSHARMMSLLRYPTQGFAVGAESCAISASCMLSIRHCPPVFLHMDIP